jgi:hypothetical protein
MAVSMKPSILTLGAGHRLAIALVVLVPVWLLIGAALGAGQ